MRGRNGMKGLSLLLKILVHLSGLVTVAVSLWIIGYIMVRGIPNLTPELFAWEYTSQNVSLMPALVNTVLMIAFALVLAVPPGVFAAIYLCEYAKKESRIVKVIRTAADTLSGIPSIVYGLFGMLFFVIRLRLGYSLAAGAFTLAVMTLPLIMRTAEEAILVVPAAYREGSYGLGAGRLKTIFAIVLPAALPGISGGIILAIGRMAGETAALIFTAGTLAKIPGRLTDSARTLAVHMYSLSSEGLYVEQSYATAAVLLLLVFFINALSAILIRSKQERL